MAAQRTKSLGPVHPYMGLNLRYWRNHRGLNGVELAKASGVVKSAISNVEKGRSNLSYPFAIKLADALNIDVAALWDHRPPPGLITRSTR